MDYDLGQIVGLQHFIALRVLEK